MNRLKEGPNKLLSTPVHTLKLNGIGMYTTLQGHFFNFLYFLDLDQTLRTDTYTIILVKRKVVTWMLCLCKMTIFMFTFHLTNRLQANLIKETPICRFNSMNV